MHSKNSFVNLKISQGWLWYHHIPRTISNLVKVLRVWVFILKLLGSLEDLWFRGHLKLCLLLKVTLTLPRNEVVLINLWPYAFRVSPWLSWLNFRRFRLKSDITMHKWYANVKPKILDVSYKLGSLISVFLIFLAIRVQYLMVSDWISVSLMLMGCEITFHFWSCSYPPLWQGV